MTETTQLDKNSQISKTRSETISRHANMSCHVYQIKIDESQLSTKQKEALFMTFTEAKWIYNAILNFSESNDIKDWYPYPKSVSVKNQNGEFEERELRYIGSQLKKAVKKSTLTSLKSLSTLKRKGYQEPGKLKFVSTYTSIDLDKHGHVYTIVSPKQVQIEKIPGRIRVNGLDQFLFEPNIEIANAKLMNTPLGYYLHITVYKKKEVNCEKDYLPPIGIDMGIKASITTSEGDLIDVMIEETERLKRLQRKIMRQQKGSNNRHKTQTLLDREYQKLSNRKDDMTNKIVAELLSHKTVYMQDEMIKGWHRRYGRKVQHSVLGRVKAKLIRHERVVVLHSCVPTTKYCPNCHLKHPDITLSDRMYVCPYCGYEFDRDMHAARNMVVMAEEGYPLKDDRRKAAWQMIRDLNARSREAAEELNVRQGLTEQELVAPILPATGMQYNACGDRTSISTIVSRSEMVVVASSVCEARRSHRLRWD